VRSLSGGTVVMMTRQGDLMTPEKFVESAIRQSFSSVSALNFYGTTQFVHNQSWMILSS
jgi:hypothetical protein